MQEEYPPHRKSRKTLCTASCGFLVSSNVYGLCLYTVVFVRNSEFLAAFGTTCSQYSATVCGSHSLTESVLVSSLSVRGLECSFHFSYILFMLLSGFGLQNYGLFLNKPRAKCFLDKSFCVFSRFSLILHSNYLQDNSIIKI